MLESMKLGTKLILAFFIITVITLGVGITGYTGVSIIMKSLYEIGVVRLPSVQGLFIISEAQTAIDSAENALLAKNLDSAGRKEAYERFDAAKKGQMKDGRFMNHYLRQLKRQHYGKNLYLHGINGGKIMKTL